MSITTSAGARVYICATPTTASDETSLAALTYVEIGKVETVGEIGPQSQDVTFTSLEGSAVQHLKGSTDNGAMTLTAARDPLDVGQGHLKTAAGTKLEYALKVVLSDGADANDTDSTFYLRGPVMGGRTNVGGANDVTKVNYSIGLNVFIEVPSETVT